MKISPVPSRSLLALAVFGVVACGEAPPPSAHVPAPEASATASAPIASASAPSAPAASAPPAPAPSMLDLQLASLRAYVHAFNAHDAKAIADLYGEGCVLIERGEWVSAGEDAISGNFQRFFDAFPDASTAITRSWHSGDTVVFEYVEGGTNTGKHPAHKPSGKRVGYVGASVLVLGPDGKIKSDTTYSDELTREVQAGWAPSSLAKIPVRPVVPVPQASDTWEVHVAKEGDADRDKVVETRKALYSNLRTEKAFVDALSDDVVLHPYDDPADAKGKKEAGKLFASWAKTFSNVAMNAKTAWAVDGYVVVQGTFTGKQTGAWATVKPTNKAFETQFLDITHANADGKIDRMWTYANNYELLLDLGFHKIQSGGDAADPTGIY